MIFYHLVEGTFPLILSMYIFSQIQTAPPIVIVVYQLEVQFIL